MKYLNYFGFVICIIVVFLPEEFILLLLIPAIIFIVNGTILLMNKH